MCLAVNGYSRRSFEASTISWTVNSSEPLPSSAITQRGRAADPWLETKVRKTVIRKGRRIKKVVNKRIVIGAVNTTLQSGQKKLKVRLTAKGKRALMRSGRKGLIVQVSGKGIKKSRLRLR